MGPNILYGQMLAGHSVKVEQLRSKDDFDLFGICLATQCTMRK